MSGRQQLVELVAEQADLEQTFNPSDPDCVDRLLQCTRQAVPLFSVSSLFYIVGILITLLTYISMDSHLRVLLKPLRISSNSGVNIYWVGLMRAPNSRNFFKVLLRDFLKVESILRHSLWFG